MALKTTRFDAAEYLNTDEAIAAFVDEALGCADAEFIAHALGVAARARGITGLAREAGLLRNDSHGAAKSRGSVKLGTIVRVMHGLGLRLAARPIAKAKRRRKTKVRRKTA